MEDEVVSVFPKGFSRSFDSLRDSFIGKSVVVTWEPFYLERFIGSRKILAGRMGESRAEGITESLVELGLKSGRLKTGTPPRLKLSSINLKKAIVEVGDKNPIPFSYRTEDFKPRNVPCYSIRTNIETHKIIRENMAESPMFTGEIKAAGPRYCPSIEDKVYRFSNQDSHLLFLEPEWLGSDQIYLNGFSTSLPEKTQIKALQTIPVLNGLSFCAGMQLSTTIFLLHN